jgi:hypothetical protein
VTDAALIVAAFAVVVALVAMTQAVALRRKLDSIPTDGDVVAMIRTSMQTASANAVAVESLDGRLQNVEARLPYAVSYIGVVAYDAFSNIAGNQSRSIAMLNQRGDGIVLSLLVSRGETVFFTKQVTNGRGSEELSPEEMAAVDRALGR